LETSAQYYTEQKMLRNKETKMRGRPTPFPSGPRADDASVPNLPPEIWVNGRLYFSLQELERCKWELRGSKGAAPVFDGADRNITAAETARSLGIHRKTLSRWLEQVARRAAATKAAAAKARDAEPAHA
jgi:hypothetical protein